MQIKNSCYSLMASIHGAMCAVIGKCCDQSKSHHFDLNKFSYDAYLGFSSLSNACCKKYLRSFVSKLQVQNFIRRAVQDIISFYALLVLNT